MQFEFGTFIIQMFFVLPLMALIPALILYYVIKLAIKHAISELRIKDDFY